MKPMYVICFYWQGDRWSSEALPTNGIYSSNVVSRLGTVDTALASRYVNNLYCGVKKFATRPFDFICFTNEKLSVRPGIELREFPLITDRGVLPRIYMFSPEAGLENRQVLCLDLDVVIVNCLHGIMAYDDLFCARSKFRAGQEYKLDGDIMSFKAGKAASRLFWEPFISDVDAAVALTNGRERYWVRHVANNFADRWDVIAPGSILSYKMHLKKGLPLTKKTSIVSCHGFPRPHQIRDAWIRDYWK
jgi:hypothetical protein